jgi:hypothetical protein
MTGLPSQESNTFLRNSIALGIPLTLLEGLKREENLWTHILTDSLDAPVRQSLSERSLKLRPAMKRKRRVPVGSK